MTDIRVLSTESAGELARRLRQYLAAQESLSGALHLPPGHRRLVAAIERRDVAKASAEQYLRQVAALLPEESAS